MQCGNRFLNQAQVSHPASITSQPTIVYVVAAVAANRALLVRCGKRFRDYAHMSHESRTAEERRILERWRGDPEEQSYHITHVLMLLLMLLQGVADLQASCKH